MRIPTCRGALCGCAHDRRLHARTRDDAAARRSIGVRPVVDDHGDAGRDPAGRRRRPRSSTSSRAMRTANPCAALSLEAEIFVNDVRVDFGSLSSRRISTNRDGRAAITYYAPAPPPRRRQTT